MFLFPFLAQGVWVVIMVKARAWALFSIFTIEDQIHLRANDLNREFYYYFKFLIPIYKINVAQNSHKKQLK